MEKDVRYIIIIIKLILILILISLWGARVDRLVLQILLKYNRRFFFKSDDLYSISVRLQSYSYLLNIPTTGYPNFRQIEAWQSSPTCRSRQEDPWRREQKRALFQLLVLVAFEWLLCKTRTIWLLLKFVDLAAS